MRRASAALARPPGLCSPNGGNDIVGVGDADRLERRAERHRYRRRTDPHDRCTEPVERQLRDLRGDLGARSERQDGFVGDITLSVEGLPPGVTCPPQVMAGPNRRATMDWKLDITRRSPSASRVRPTRGAAPFSRIDAPSA